MSTSLTLEEIRNL
jgi:protein unc-119